jgi:hypothetical protein
MFDIKLEHEIPLCSLEKKKKGNKLILNFNSINHQLYQHEKPGSADYMFRIINGLSDDKTINLYLLPPFEDMPTENRTLKAGESAVWAKLQPNVGYLLSTDEHGVETLAYVTSKFVAVCLTAVVYGTKDNVNIFISDWTDMVENSADHLASAK